jgi:pyruvate dehydrogenase E2 component (dihydrolipoamide acetyltransferase)
MASLPWPRSCPSRSVDHRVIDGALGAELLQAIVDNLENPMVMLA